MKTAIVVIGLPGAGKTTLADIIGRKLNAARINADFVRIHFSSDLGFSISDRYTQAMRLGQLANLTLASSNNTSVIDFVCPLAATREGFTSALHKNTKRYFVWMNTIKESRFEDTNKLYEAPVGCDYVVDSYCSLDELERHADKIIADCFNDKGQEYLVRFNTKADLKDPNALLWRIIDSSGGEKLASTFYVNKVPMYPKKSVEYGIDKWNVAFFGEAVWNGTEVHFL